MVPWEAKMSMDDWLVGWVLVEWCGTFPGCNRGKFKGLVGDSTAKNGSG